MNTFSNNPSAALQVAHHIIDDRIQQAEARAVARTIRHQRRHARDGHDRTGPTGSTAGATPLWWWATRFLHPAH
jgi:hypothetical protein